MSPVQVSEFQASYQDTEASTAETVRAMCAHIREAVQDPEVQRLAASCGGPASVWAWLKQNVRFETDESQLQRTMGRGDELELLISPSVLLRAADRAGDCDDFTMLACALLALQGFTPAIKTYKCDSSDPSRWSHVCAAILLPSDALPFDASHGEYYGWEVPARDVYESQLWDMNGNKVPGGRMRKGRGLSGYVREPEWTGNEMTTVDGRVAGPYPNGDVMRAYYPGPRSRGLRGIAKSKYGMGALTVIGQDCSSGECEAVYGDDGSSSGFPSAAAGASGQQAAYNAQYGTAAGNSFNWGSLFGSLLGSGTKLASQAIGPGAQVLPNGNVLLPSGQVISGSPQSAGISSTTLLIGALLIGGVFLVSSMKK